LRALPESSLIFLARTDKTITPLPDVSSRQAASLLTDGFEKALTILVEDDAASILLSEILRNSEPTFLSTVRIAVAREKREGGRIDASGKDAIRNTMKTLSESGLKVAAVLDGGESADTANFIFVLPGNKPPEAELVGCPQVKQMLCDRYNLQASALDALLAEEDCHAHFQNIGRRVSCDADFLIREAAREYVKALPPADVNRLLSVLKDASNRK